jgi:hypothetical protein
VHTDPSAVQLIALGVQGIVAKDVAHRPTLLAGMGAYRAPSNPARGRHQ